MANKKLEEEVLACLQERAVRLLFQISRIPDDWPGFLDKIERTHPDVVIVDVTKLAEPLEEIVRRIRSTKAQPAIYAVHTSADSQSILDAFRGGATEFLSPPMEGPLKAALDRLAQAKEATNNARGSAKTIAFASAKGGCGATTIACHFAIELAQRTQGKVLLADLDLESGLIGFLLKSKSPYTLADAAHNLQYLDDSYWHGITSSGPSGIEIITAPAVTVPPQVSPEELHRITSFARGLYDWIVLDLGRNLTAYTLPLLDQIDELHLVLTYEIPALHQAKEIIQKGLRTGYSRDRIRPLLNRMPKHTDLTLEEIDKMLGLPVFQTIPNDYSVMQEAVASGCLVEPSSSVAKSVAHLVARDAGLEEKKEKLLLFG